MRRRTLNVNTSKAGGLNGGRKECARIDVDVSEALTGLKAIQREAKKATQALRELEAKAEVTGYLTSKTSGDIADGLVQMKNASYDLSYVSTKELHEELARREGVAEYEVSPHQRAVIGLSEVDSRLVVDGPARILVNVD